MAQTTLINFFSIFSRDWKSKVKVSAGVVSPEASLLDVQTATFSLFSQGLSRTRF